MAGRPVAMSFVERHGLWTGEQARAAKAAALAIKKHKLELVRFSFADQHGVLRGKTVLAEDAPGLMQAGVTMTTTLLAKDTAHKSAFPVFTPGGGFDMAEMQGAGDFVMVADPATFQVLPWSSNNGAPNTGWFLCDMFFPNGKPVPFSTRQILRDALARLKTAGFDYLAGLEVEFHLFKLENPRLTPEDATWPPRAPVRSDRRGAGADPPWHHRARHAAALGGSRAGAQPVRIHLPPAGGPRRCRYHDLVPRRHQTDRAAPRIAGKLHVPAGAAKSFFLGLAPAPVAARSPAR